MTIIADSDALVALAHPGDALHQRCAKIYQYLIEHDIETFTPYAVILEAATVLSRVFGRSDLAREVLENYSEVKVDTDVANLVVKLYNPKTSKKNTPFDHYVLALAKKNNIEYIFSFDSFYKKNGLTLAEELVK